MTWLGLQSERLEDLQREYHRVVRLADLSRSNSKESQAKWQQAQQSLASVRSSAQRHAAHFVPPS